MSQAGQPREVSLERVPGSRLYQMVSPLPSHTVEYRLRRKDLAITSGTLPRNSSTDLIPRMTFNPASDTGKTVEPTPLMARSTFLGSRAAGVTLPSYPILDPQYLTPVDLLSKEKVGQDSLEAMTELRRMNGRQRLFGIGEMETAINGNITDDTNETFFGIPGQENTIMKDSFDGGEKAIDVNTADDTGETLFELSEPENTIMEYLSVSGSREEEHGRFPRTPTPEGRDPWTSFESSETETTRE